MILVVGANGSIGRRYMAILEHLTDQVSAFDDPNCSYDEMIRACLHIDHDRILIASPTETHPDWIRAAVQSGKPFLCEKPITKDMREVEALTNLISTNPSPVQGFVVNNYAYLHTINGFPEKVTEISYDFYNTGKDGLIWDCCQLIYLAYLTKARLHIQRKSYSWDMHVNDFEIPYKAIETSYFQMLRDFMAHKFSNLWTIEQGLYMSRLCHNLEIQYPDPKEVELVFE